MGRARCAQARSPDLDGLAEVLAKLTPAEAKRVDELRAVLREVWMPRAENKPQQMAYMSKADVIGYGGAAGGGKSDLGLGMALTRHRTVQAFRREGTELGALIDRCAQILGTRDGLSGRPAVWRNPTPTCDLIEFCSAPHLGDEQGFQGRAKDLLWFDEAANFLEYQVRFLMGWVRPSPGTDRGRPPVHGQTLLTFNPPTNVDGRWIIAFFAPWLDHQHPDYPAKCGELRWFYTDAEGKERETSGPEPVIDAKGNRLLPMSRTFIRARVKDNPDLANSAQYLAILDGMPEPQRSLFRDGDFRAAMEDDVMQVIPTAWVEAAMARWKPRNPMPEMDSVGVDVAMKGRDNTIIARRHAHWFDVPIVYEGHRCPDGPTVAGYIISAQRDRAPIHIDLFGVGAEPYGHLMKMQAPVLGVSMAEKSSEIAIEGRRRFFNVRSMLWWRMREALNPTNPLQIDLPNDRRLLADLCAPKWEERAGGIIYVQGREEIVDTIGRSPDFGTAYILALMHNPVLRGQGAGWERKNQPYDPLEGMDEWRRNWRNQ